jgi:hypothetical protein
VLVASERVLQQRLVGEMCGRGADPTEWVGFAGQPGRRQPARASSRQTRVPVRHGLFPAAVRLVVRLTAAFAFGRPAPRIRFGITVRRQTLPAPPLSDRTRHHDGFMWNATLLGYL